MQASQQHYESRVTPSRRPQAKPVRFGDLRLSTWLGDTGIDETVQVMKVQSVTAPPRILLVDDDQPFRELLKRFLELKGLAVIECTNGVDALDALMTHPGHIDVLMTEVVIPRLDGFLLAREAAVITPWTRHLFVTGYAEERPHLRRALECADTPFLLKPFTQAQLLDALQPLLTAVTLPPVHALSLKALGRPVSHRDPKVG